MNNKLKRTYQKKIWKIKIKRIFFEKKMKTITKLQDKTTITKNIF